jgi:hypothetical protein
MKTATEWAITKRVRINSHLSVDITVGPGGAVAEWIGGEPKFLTAVERRRYRDGRDELLAQVAKKIGGNILLVEV